MNFLVCVLFVVLSFENQYVFSSDATPETETSIPTPPVLIESTTESYQHLTTEEQSLSSTTLIGNVLNELLELEENKGPIIEQHTNVLNKNPNEITMEPKDYTYEILPSVSTQTISFYTKTIESSTEEPLPSSTPSNESRGTTKTLEIDDMLTLPPSVLKTELENLNEKQLYELLNKIANNISSTAIENETVLMKLCMDFMHNNDTCAHLYNLGKNEQYFSLTWEITYRMFLIRPFGVFVFIIWTIILCVLNFFILFLCTLLKPLRSFLLTKIVSDLRRRYYFTSDSSEMRIIDQFKK